MPDVSTLLSRYRRAQRRTRALFAPFTREHCPTCTTSCCRKPNWVRPVDLILVEELGYHVPRRQGESGGVAPLAELLTLSDVEAASGAGEPCDFLSPRGCGFPADLRPFGCVAFICQPMRLTVSAEELSHVEIAVQELTVVHRELMAVLHANPTPSPGPEEPEAR